MVGTVAKESMVGRPLQFSLDKTHHFFQRGCHNLNLELTTKARVCKVAGQEGNPGITSSAPRGLKECEGMNLHIPK